MEILNWFRVEKDRGLALLAVAAAVVALILGYLGVSGTPYVAKQMSFIISGGIVGIVLAGVGATLWLSADLRDEWQELRELRMTLREQQIALTRLGGEQAAFAPSNGSARDRTPAGVAGEQLAGSSSGRHA